MQLLKVRLLKGFLKQEKQNEDLKISASILQLTLIKNYLLLTFLSYFHVSFRPKGGI